MDGSIVGENLDIDISGLEKALAEIGQSRLLYQFQNSKVLCELLSAVLEEVQESYDILISILVGRTVDDAQGAALDVLGRLVGQERLLLNVTEKQYFQWDEADSRWDSEPLFVKNAPLSGNLPASDFEYRQLIVSKIFKNHVKHCSVPEIITFIRLVYGINVSVKRVNAMDLELVMPANTSSGTIATIQSFITNEFADQQFFIPMPATGRITAVTLVPEVPFRFDETDQGWDQGNWPIST